MFKRKVSVLVIMLFFCMGQKSFAQVAPVPDVAKTQTTTMDSRAQSDSTPDNTDENQSQPVQVDNSSANNSRQTVSTPVKNNTNSFIPMLNTKPQAKENDEPTKNNEQPPTFNNDSIVKKTVPVEWQPTVTSFLNKHNLNLNGILTILGLLGTFLGLFSSWSIYILNKKNSDPMVIDKKDCAIKYIEALDRIKEVIFINKTRKSDAILERILEQGLPPLGSDDFNYLISFYRKITAEISEVPLVEIHSRYKKHIKHNNIELFNSLLAFYKMITNDSKIYEQDMDFSTLKLSNRDWKNKVCLLLGIDSKIIKIKNILHKDLRG